MRKEHKDRKSYKKWGQTGQLVASVTSFEHIKTTASNKGAFNRIVKRHLVSK